MARYDLYILNSSSAVVAAMPDAVWEISETLNVEDTLRAVLFEADKFTLVTAESTFIQLINPADSTDKRTYRLTSVEQARSDGRHTLKCEGARIWSDMAREIFTLTHPVTGKVTGWHPYHNIQVKTIVAKLMGSSAFQIKSGGNAESDTTIIESVELSTTTVLEALQRIAEKADLEIEIDESTSPESIDLKTRGSDNGVRFEYSINSGGMARRFRRAEVVNKIYPVGGGEPPATCEGALFEVSSISTDTITVAGNKCIPSNDTYNTFKIKMVTGDDAGDLFVIGDTVRGSTGDDDTIQLTTTPSDVSAGDLFKFTDASGVELTYVPDAASQTTYGTFDGVVRDTQFEATRTLITPGYMDGTYGSGLHVGWTKVGTPTVAKESGIDYIQHGIASQHITAGSANLGVYNAVALDSSDHYSAAVNLFIVSGSVEVKVSTTGQGGVSYRNQGGTSGTDWVKVELEGIPIEGSTATLTIQSTGGAAEFYIDAVSFTGTQQTREFVRENGARELYRMAFDYLDEHDAPVVEYDLPNALDLFNIDAAQYPFNDLSIGDTVKVVDPGMALAASVRVLSLGFDSEGRRLRVKLSSHTSTLAAFSQVAPGIGRVVIGNRNDAQAANEHNSNLEGVHDTTARVGRIAPPVARHARFSGSFTAKSQTTFDVGGGDLHMGDSLTYTIAAQLAVSVPSVGDVYYIYFNPSAASSGIQVTTAAATAYTSENIQLGVAVPGATSIDLVQIIVGSVAATGKSDIVYDSAGGYGLRVQNDNASNIGYAGLMLRANSASPASNDYVSWISMRGNDVAGTDVGYAEIISAISSTTAGAHTGKLYLFVSEGGTSRNVISLVGKAITFNNVFTFPQVDGSANQVLKTDGSGNLTWVAMAGEGSVDGTGTANYISKWSDSDTQADSVMFNNGTNVGIGTNNPQQELHIYGSGAQLRLESSGSGAGQWVEFYNSGGRQGFIGNGISGGDMAIYLDNADDILFYTNATLRATINGAGLFAPSADQTYDLGSGTKQWQNVRATNLYLGIDAGTPVYSIENWSSSNNYMRMFSSNANGAAGYIFQNDAMMWWMYAQGSGSDRITWYNGTDALVAMYLSTAGAAYNETGTWGTISDRRIKTEITDARDYWDDFKTLQFRKYKLIADVEKYDDLAPSRLGLVAQEVFDVFPGCVDTDDPNLWAVKSSIINTIGLKVTQETQGRVETLEKQIATLEAEVAVLKAA